MSSPQLFPSCHQPRELWPEAQALQRQGVGMLVRPESFLACGKARWETGV